VGNGYRSATCERVRAQIALELDREFSQLERARRVSHVAHCGECRAFEADLAAFTQLLRDAPPERPSRAFTVPRRGVGVRSLRTSAVAAAATVLALVGVTTQIATDLATSERGSAARSGPTVYPTNQALESEVEIIEVLGESPRLVAATADLR
jgi:predicted anti-sigma-YlaC factor YlaD